MQGRFGSAPKLNTGVCYMKSLARFRWDDFSFQNGQMRLKFWGELHDAFGCTGHRKTAGGI